ncbi:related to RTM1 protein [Cephalotrichum gorgonifer]|uniref:Related to RTM1 protein n=1 Tax=Cephalotrichum gorgonifer TaxID=2041049 RepID=A0AAE8N756_9PEZI|nr:related to RTM1 protein [Cephalotrichum gorgonifer]
MSILCNPNWREAEWSMYRYVPSTGPAVIFCLLFLVSGIIHGWQMWKTKAWFLSALVAGCFLEFIGYAARAASAGDEPGCWRMMPYIIQTIFILLGPALFSASIYMILGRIIILVDGGAYSLVNPRLITRIFVAGDILWLFLQSGSGGLIAGGRNVPIMGRIGNGLVIACLFAQTLWFFFFVAVAVVFHRRMLRAPTAASQEPNIRWEHYLHTLYAVGILVMVRSLFRAIEFIGGSGGTLMTSEVYLYVLDALLMFVAVALLHWRHPGEISVLARGGRPDTNGLRLLLPKA